MATATHIPQKLMLAQGELSSTLGVNFDDTTANHFKCGLVVAGSGIPSTNATGVQFISDVTSGNAEMSYAGYARQSLTGVTWATGSDNVSVDWSFSNIVFPQEAADPGTARYGFIAYLGPSGSYADTAAPVVAILDLGGTISTVNGSQTLQSPTGGLIQYTGAG